MRFFLGSVLLASLSFSAAAQPARLLDINPNGSDGVQSRSLAFAPFAYTQNNVDRSTRHRNAFVQWNGEAHFFADDGASGLELWRTNGSAEGTEIIADLATGTVPSFPSTPIVYADAMYFTASTGSNRSLWRYDGFEIGQVTDRDLLPVGVAPDLGGLILSGEGGTHVLGSCEDDDGPLLCAIGELFAASIGPLVQLRDAGYFTSGSMAYRTLLTPATTTPQFPGGQTGGDRATNLGRMYRVGDLLLMTCFYESASGVDPGSEMCTSAGGINDIALLDDHIPGPAAAGIEPIGVYGDRLYALARDPNAPGDFLIFATAGGPWEQVSTDNRETYNASSADDVFMLPASGADGGTATGYLTERARTDGPFPQTELALFRADGSRVTADGTDWNRVRTAEAKGFFAAGTNTASRLYQWDGASGVTDLGALGSGPGDVRTFNGGALMVSGSELWTYDVEVRAQRQRLDAPRTVSFALSASSELLPFSLDVTALGTGGEILGALGLRSQTPLAGPADATALLDPFVSLRGARGLSGLEGALTLSYSEASLSEAGIATEAELQAWISTPGAGFASGGETWTPLAIVSRDPAANTVTTAPITALGDIVLGTSMPVSAEPEPLAAAALSAPSPNPARDGVAVTVTLDSPEAVRVSLHDALGREVAVVRQGTLAAGAHRLRMSTRDLAPGVYVVRLVSAERSETQRLTILR